MTIALPRKVILLFPLLFLFAVTQSYALDVTLGWDANTEPDLAGYKVYYKIGSSGEPYDGTGADQGSSPVTVPILELADSDNPEYALSGLSDSEVYFFVVTAYNTEALESYYSNEAAILPITSPQNGFYVNASNYTSYTVEGKASPNADDIIVKAEWDTNSDTIGGPFEDDDGDGNWSGACDFTSIEEGSVSLTAESGGSTSPAVTGTIDITAPSSSATALDYENGTFSLTWTASDETSGVASTELWYNGPGGIWANSGLAAQTGTSGTFFYTPTGEEEVEEGAYYFATRSTDNASNLEEEPSGDGDISYTIEPSSPPSDGTDENGDGSAVGSGDSGGDGRCFIATAAFGLNMDWHVQILSQFRDKRLANNHLGQRFIALYNKFFSPF